MTRRGLIEWRIEHIEARLTVLRSAGQITERTVAAREQGVVRVIDASRDDGSTSQVL